MLEKCISWNKCFPSVWLLRYIAVCKSMFSKVGKSSIAKRFPIVIFLSTFKKFNWQRSDGKIEIHYTPPSCIMLNSINFAVYVSFWTFRSQILTIPSFSTKPFVFTHGRSFPTNYKSYKKWLLSVVTITDKYITCACRIGSSSFEFHGNYRTEQYITQCVEKTVRGIWPIFRVPPTHWWVKILVWFIRLDRYKYSTTGKRGLIEGKRK